MERSDRHTKRELDLLDFLAVRKCDMLMRQSFRYEINFTRTLLYSRIQCTAKLFTSPEPFWVFSLNHSLGTTGDMGFYSVFRPPVALVAFQVF